MAICYMTILLHVRSTPLQLLERVLCPPSYNNKPNNNAIPSHK